MDLVPAERITPSSSGNALETDFHSDRVFQVPPGTTPDYNSNNPLLKLLHLGSRQRLAAEREFYLTDHIQYLVPFSALDLYGPQGGDFQNLDPATQDNKTDFQKQNVRDFRATDTYLIRGWVTAGDWTGPFLKLSYRGGPDSRLADVAGNRLGGRIKLWLKVGDRATPELISVPYVEATDRYEIELWGFPGVNLRDRLGPKGQESLSRGELIARPDLIRGLLSDFDREGKDDVFMTHVSPDNTMHPILPLHVEAAWADEVGSAWDSQFGANYQYEFNMIVRGWDNYTVADPILPAVQYDGLGSL